MKEYRILVEKFFRRTTEYELNKLARDGWEVVKTCDGSIILEKNIK